jgi:hypothetical protein
VGFLLLGAILFLFSIYVSGTDGEVVNAQVCKTCIRGFNSRLVLQQSSGPATRGCMKESEHGYLW